MAFTRSLSENLAGRKIPASFAADKVATFGQDVPLGQPGQPEEVAPCFVFLASDDASYMTGQVLHPNGGEIING